MVTAGPLEQGILAIWHDIAPPHVADVLAWYDAEHHFERLDVPGFLSVRRYHAVEGTPFLFIRYETTGADVLSSAPYLERLNRPTPGTQQAQPRFRNNSRTVCVRVARAGRAEGGFVVTARREAGSGLVPETDWPRLASGLMGGADDTAPGLAGIIGAELWRAQAAASAIPTAEKRLRRVADGLVSEVVVVHATGRTAADAAADGLRRLLPETAAARIGIYALAFAASNPPC